MTESVVFTFEDSVFLAVLLALATFPAVLLIQAALRRFSNALFLAFVGHGSLWIAGLLMSGFRQPLPLWQPPADPSAWVAGGATVLTLWLGWFEVFSVLCRGFSLQLMVEIEAVGGLSATDAESRYAGGRGLEWMMEKRIAGLVAVKLIRRQGSDLQLTPSGRVIARLAAVYKRIVRIGAGG